MYNLKLVRYPVTGLQEIVTYSRPIKKAQERRYDEIDINRQKSMREVLEGEIRALRSSVNRTKQTINDYARANIWDWFVTWTFDGKKIDRYDYEKLSRFMSNWLCNVRKRKAPDLRYVVVPERHQDGAYHFHGLLANAGALRFEDSGRKTKAGAAVYNLLDYRIGFTTATKIRDTARASSYITKYITSELIHHTKGRKRYWCSRNLAQGDIEKIYVGSDVLQQLEMMYPKEKIIRKKEVVIAPNEHYRNHIKYLTISSITEE